MQLNFEFATVDGKQAGRSSLTSGENEMHLLYGFCLQNVVLDGKQAGRSSLTSGFGGQV